MKIYSLLLILGIPLTLGAQPIDLGDRLELMVDHYLIAEMRGVSLKLHEPKNAGAALKFTDPWDRDASGYATIMEDGGRYRL